MENIEQHIPTKTDGYDQDFLFAYHLLCEHVAAGNASTVDLAKTLGELPGIRKVTPHETPPCPW